MATEVYDRHATSYDLDTALRIDIEDMVHQLSPFDAPFQGTFNGNSYPGEGPRSILPTGSVFEVKYEWLEDELLTPRSNLSAAYPAASGSLALTTGEAIRFQPDDLVRVKKTAGGFIQFLVDSVDYSNDTLTVTLWSGTDGGADNGTLVEGIGTVPVEGADPTDARATDRSRLFNYTHIWGPYPVEMSETELVVRKYGVSNEWEYQVAKRVKEGAIAFEHAILYGTRKLDTTNRRRSMGGLDYFITTNVDSSTTSLDGTGGETALRTLQQDCYAKGGQPGLVVVGPAQRPVISDWRKSDIRFQPTGSRRGQVVETFESDFGVIDVMMHRWVRDSDLFLFDPAQAEISTLEGRGIAFEVLAKTGDRRKAMVVGEKGFKFRGEAHAAKMTALT